MKEGITENAKLLHKKERRGKRGVKRAGDENEQQEEEDNGEKAEDENAQMQLRAA